MNEIYQTIFQLGLAIIACLLAGNLSSRIKLPHVSAYILVGIALGPYGMKWITEGDIEIYKIFGNFGLGLIMFAIGTVFQEELLRIGKKLITFALCDIIFSFVFTFLFVKFSGQSLSISIFLSVMAIATAPAATLMVIMEYRSKGPVTDHILALMALNNISCMILFQFILIFYGVTVSGSSDYAFVGIIDFIVTLVTSIIFGGIFGFIYSYLEIKEKTHSELLVLLFGTLGLMLGLAHHYNLFPHLAAIAMGTMISNLSFREKEIQEDIQNFGLPFFILFFVLSGVEFHIEGLHTIGAVTILYITGRSVGKLLGIYTGARITKSDEEIGYYTGFGMLSQLGLVVGLSLILKATYPYIGIPVYNIIISSVLVFEIVGPFLVRAAVVSAGEVRAQVLIAHPGRTRYENDFVRLSKTLMQKVGMMPHQVKAIDPSDIKVKNVCRSNVKTINSKTPFREMLGIIEKSPYDHFPVVDDENNFIGMITYDDIRDILVDKSLSLLLLAQDIVHPNLTCVYEEDNLSVALKKFSEKNLSYLPVLSNREHGKIVGMLEQRDVVTLHSEFIKKEGDTKN